MTQLLPHPVAESSMMNVRMAQTIGPAMRPFNEMVRRFQEKMMAGKSRQSVVLSKLPRRDWVGLRFAAIVVTVLMVAAAVWNEPSATAEGRSEQAA